MPGMSDYSAQNWLNYIVGKTAIPALPSPFLALFTAVGIDAGSGFTEVSGNSYARTAASGATWNASSGSAPSTITNASSITFPTSTGSWGTVIAWGLYDASSTGNLLVWDYLGNFAWKPFTCTLASPGVLTVPAHGYANADQVVVDNEYGGTLPTTGGSWTGLLTVANVTTDTFTAGVNTTSTGSGLVRKVSSSTIGAGTTPIFNAAALTISAA